MERSISTEAPDSFLERRDLRAASEALTRHLVLGYGIGMIALLLGCYRYFVVGGASARAWAFVAGLGVVILLGTLVLPSAWAAPERGIRRFGNFVGHGLMTALLVLVYYLVVWPLGTLARLFRGSHPIYEWKDTPPRMEGWSTKELPGDVRKAQSKGRAVRAGLFGVIVFFARARNFFLIPALIILVSLGIALFFLQTSALAPFIYTLF